MLKKISDKIDNEWFFSDAGPVLKLLHIYIKGDIIVLAPLCLVFIVTGIFSWQFMLLEIGLYLFLRGIGEMVYWLLQQFGDRKYRPFTNYKKLDNNAVYILYQLNSMITAIVGGVIIVIACLNLFIK